MSKDYLDKLMNHCEEIADIAGSLASTARALDATGNQNLAKLLAAHAKSLSSIQSALNRDYDQELNSQFKASWGAIADTLKAAVDRASE